MGSTNGSGNLHLDRFTSVAIDDIQQSDFSTTHGAVVHKVYTPTLIRSTAGSRIEAALGSSSLAFAPMNLQAFFAANPAYALMVIHVAINKFTDVGSPALALLSLMANHLA